MKLGPAIFALPLLLLATSAPADTPSSRPSPAAGELKTPGFFIDLAAAAAGHGLDDPSRLPPEFRNLWNAAIVNDTNSNLPGTLDALHALYAAFSAVPHGMERLEAITRHERQESFGQWMAETHVNLLTANIKTPSFDLRDVPEVERPFLIGIFKERTLSVLESLKPYLPPLDEKTGHPAAFAPEQLAGITAANAIEVKHQALSASAILLAQISLEPDMPLADRQLLRTQLLEVRRVLSAASILEPAAKAALAQADREKRLADLHARQEALRHPAPTPAATNPAPSH